MTELGGASGWIIVEATLHLQLDCHGATHSLAMQFAARA